jgi:hypothetical protein
MRRELDDFPEQPDRIAVAPRLQREDRLVVAAEQSGMNPVRANLDQRRLQVCPAAIPSLCGDLMDVFEARRERSAHPLLDGFRRR